ncbi:recombinase family protein [Mycobacterium sp. 3-98]|uniref:recombinase family protein n=1 Tax=Mycobacterium sp. 3-98 TaxID=3042317 RepID=UPI002DDA95D8|nr:recombinase family protein [Mycobacterium sp. 3-98]WSE46434.1 recombinase family protein [Mycobacterium sp. 3-98]
MTTALYLRQSLDRTRDEAAIDRQRAACRGLAKQRGWANPTEYVDNDRSASNGKPRPAYQDMLRDIRDGKITAIACWHVDRLYRQPRDLEDLIELCEAHGIALATCVGDVDLSTDMGRLVARLLGAVNRGEVERKAARQKLAARQMAERGIPKWRNAFGYTEDYQPHPVESQLVREAYDTIISGGSLSGIAREWNQRGHVGRNGNNWSASTLSLFLRAPRNAGLRAHNNEIVGWGSWPPLVDEPTWRAAQAVLNDPARKPGPRTCKRHFLTGVLQCGKCGDGGRIGGYQGTKGQQRYRCWKCLGVAVNKPDVDDLIRGIVCARLARPDAKDVLIDYETPDLDQLSADANVIRARMDELATEFAEGDLTASQLRTATERLKSKLSDIEGQMIDASRARVFDGLPLGTERVQDVFRALDVDRQRAVVSALLTATILPVGKHGRVAFDPERIAIEWHR